MLEFCTRGLGDADIVTARSAWKAIFDTKASLTPARADWNGLAVGKLLERVGPVI